MTTPQSKPVPKPYLVRTALEEILTGLVEGDPVPSERDLAARCGVARETVRQAVHELLVEGRIERRGRGTVISKPKLVQPLSLKSYAEGAQTMGRNPGRILVGWDDIEATPELAAALNVGAGTPAMHLERILLADGQRIGLESTYLAKHRFGHFAGSFDPTTSLYAAVRASGVEFGWATEQIETVLASPREAALLECSTATPMLRLQRRTVDTAGKPIEVVRSLYRGDRVAFEALLTDR